MSVLNMSSPRTLPEADLEQLAQLAVTLSRRLTRVLPEEMEAVIAEALAEVVAEIRVDSCRLLEFADSGAVTRAHGGAGTGPDGQVRPPAAEAWLIERLTRGEIVDFSRPDDPSRDAPAPPPPFLLAVPAVLGGQVVCALVVDSARSSRRWPPLLIERLQLLSEILGAALLRARHESALRASVAVIEGLNARLQADNVYLKEEIKNYHDFDDIVGESPALRLALTRLSQVAPTNSSVLLLGPTGTGKELFARALHERSRRHTRPLVRVNCAALPPTLVESELFGHEKGAFTGAVANRQGRFELADGGTIFLDEIGDLAPDIQVKFLRVLQEGEFERVGSSARRRSMSA